MNESTNSVSVAGRLSRLELSHRIYGEAFYTFFLECGRLSEKSDVLPVTVSERLLTKHRALRRRRDMRERAATVVQ